MKRHPLTVINLFGTSGSGKSTTAARLFAAMNNGHNKVELINEHAKQMVWEGQHARHFENQLSITANQHNKQLNLAHSNMEFCITDSPLLLGHVYTPKDYFPSYSTLLDEVFDSFININFLLVRNSFAYDPVGRNQTEEQSKQLHHDIINMLHAKSISYYPLDSNYETYSTIIEILQHRGVIAK